MISELLLTALLAGTIAETGTRAWRGLPLLPRKNLLRAWSDLLETNTLNCYDPTFGWALRPDVVADGFNTDSRGFRTHGPGTLPWQPKRGILAVGDSYTAGSEVVDQDTWPAQLERLLRIPVANGGVGGWGTDQIALRAERLAPVLDPAVVVVSFAAEDILRSGFRVYGRGFKPWFTLAGDGGLVLNGVPVPTERERPLGPVRSLVGYSAFADLVFSRLHPTWWRQDADDYRPTGADATEVTRRLLARLTGRPTLLMIQWGGLQIAAWERRPDYAVPVIARARELGLPVLDLWDELRGHPDLRSLYIPHGDDYGHMSAAGNALVARSVADALQRFKLLDGAGATADAAG